MTDLMLRLYDGYTHTSPQLRDTVRELQAMLRRHDRDVVIDGLYGRGTEDLVRTFQQTRGLRSDEGQDGHRNSALAVGWPRQC